MNEERFHSYRAALMAESLLRRYLGRPRPVWGWLICYDQLFPRSVRLQNTLRSRLWRRISRLEEAGAVERLQQSVLLAREDALTLLLPVMAAYCSRVAVAPYTLIYIWEQDLYSTPVPGR